MFAIFNCQPAIAPHFGIAVAVFSDANHIYTLRLGIPILIYGENWARLQKMGSGNPTMTMCIRCSEAYPTRYLLPGNRESSLTPR